MTGLPKSSMMLGHANQELARVESEVDRLQKELTKSIEYQDLLRQLIESTYSSGTGTQADMQSDNTDPFEDEPFDYDPLEHGPSENTRPEILEDDEPPSTNGKTGKHGFFIFQGVSIDLRGYSSNYARIMALGLQMGAYGKSVNLTAVTEFLMENNFSVQPKSTLRQKVGGWLGECPEAHRIDRGYYLFDEDFDEENPPHD